jgi:alpha-galactosidase
MLFSTAAAAAAAVLLLASSCLAPPASSADAWIPPAPDSPDLLPFLRNTSMPKLAYSTWVGWYMDGGLNETSLFAQVEAMATTLRPHGWTHVLHDYGWQVCGTTYAVKEGCIRVDANGRLYPSWERYPSTKPPSGGPDVTGTWKPFTDRVHAKGIAYGLHLMHGIPKLAVADKLPILDVSTGANSPYTADMIVLQPLCQTFIPDHWAINASHPGAQLYYDSVVKKWADEGIDFIYLDGVNGPCGCPSIGLISDALQRLGNGMHLFISAGPPTGSCPFDSLSAAAPYVRVGSDTVDSWEGSVKNGFSQYTRLTAPSVRPHHFGDLASLMVGNVHCGGGASACAKKGAATAPGPDYVIPSAHSAMTLDEVYSYASMVAIFRSTWWPSGVLSDMTALQRKMLTNDAVIRVTMAGAKPRQVIDAASKSFAGPGIVWTSSDDDDKAEGEDGADGAEEGAKQYVLLVNLADNATLTVGVAFEELGIPHAHSCDVLELWNSSKIERASGTLEAKLRPHACLLAALTNCGPTARY